MTVSQQEIHDSRRGLVRSFAQALSRALVALVPIVFILSGCMQTFDRALDAQEADRASITGYGDIRSYLDARLDEFPRNAGDWAPATKSSGLDVLMISGGGSAGAFSVGVLSAWSASQTRPEFDVVTGVSTGALIHLWHSSDRLTTIPWCISTRAASPKTLREARALADCWARAC